VGALVSERDLGVVEVNPHREVLDYSQNTTGHHSSSVGSLPTAPAVHGRNSHPAKLLREQSSMVMRRASTGAITADTPLLKKSFLPRGEVTVVSSKPTQDGRGKRSSTRNGSEVSEDIWMHLAGATEGGIPLPAVQTPLLREARGRAEDDDGGGDLVGGGEAGEGVENLTSNGEEDAGGMAVVGGKFEEVVDEMAPLAARGADDAMVTVSQEWLEA